MVLTAVGGCYGAVVKESATQGSSSAAIMSSEHVCLLRKPLPPKRFPPTVKYHPAPRPSVMLRDLSDAGTRGSSRRGSDTPTLRAAPPTPLLPNTSTLQIEGFPHKLSQSSLRNPLLNLLKSDKHFQAPTPAFSLNDFLQSHHSSQHNSQSTPQTLPASSKSRPWCNARPPLHTTKHC